MDKSSDKKCCGGQVHNTGYSTEPETIDLRPFDVNVEDRQQQIDKMNELFKQNLEASVARQDRMRKKAILQPLFLLLEQLDHDDPKNAELITSIKQQLVALARGEQPDAIRKGASHDIKTRSILRSPNAFRLKSNPPTPVSCGADELSPVATSVSNVPSPLFSSAGQITPRMPTVGCDGFLTFLSNLIKPFVSRSGSSTEETTIKETAKHQQEKSSEEEEDAVVATHNHSEFQPCRPTCWAFDAASVAKTQNYFADNYEKKDMPASIEPVIRGHSVTTSLRVPLHFSGI